MDARVALHLLKDTYSEWNSDGASRLAAALSFYAIFSLGPLILIVTAGVGLFFGHDAARGGIQGLIQDLVGAQAAGAIETMIEVANEPRSGLIATVMGVGTLLFGAMRLFGQLEEALNTIWEATPPARGLRAIVKKRVLSFLMVLGVGFLLLVSLALTAFLASVAALLGNGVPGGGLIWQALNLLVSFGITTVLFAMIYRLLPAVEILWRDVWLGAAVTSLLSGIGKLVIGLYLGIASVGSPFGAAGSLVVLLVWIYYSAQVFFFGAEFTQVYANTVGSRAQPATDTVREGDSVAKEAATPAGKPWRHSGRGASSREPGAW